MLINFNKIYHKLCCLAKKVVSLEEKVANFEDNGTNTFSTTTDNGDGTYTVTNEDGSEVVITTALDTDTFSTAVDNADGTWTITNADNTIVTITSGSIVDNGDGTCTISFPDGTSKIITLDTDTNTWVTWEDNGDGTATFTDPDNNTLDVCLECPKHNIIDITTTITDPFDANDSVLDCGQYEIGDTLFIGADPLCPDFVYQIFDDGSGGCVIKMITKPDSSNSSTGG